MIAIPGGVLCVGNIVSDVVVRPVEQLAFETTVWVESIEQHMGGNGANTSYTLAKLGTPVCLFSRVGDDEFGASLMRRLTQAGVDLTGVESRKQPTSVTVVLVKREGPRMFLHHPGVALVEEALHLPFGQMGREFSHLHIANPFSGTAIRRTCLHLLQQAKAAGLTTSLDTGWDSRGEWMQLLAPCLPHIDIFFANELEACRITGEEGSHTAAAHLLDKGCGAVVVKRGSSGCCLYEGTTTLVVMAFTVEAKDTTGAGDCFSGGFLAGLHKGLEPDQAARLANAVGALSVQSLGSTTGILDYEATRVWMAKE